jgi:thioredoxin reductase (NADPH)
MTTTEVENFPGFPTGIQGPELMENLRAQAERFGAELVPDDVTAVDLTGQIKQVWTGDDRYGGRTLHTARAVILATGSVYRRLGIPGETDLSGHGVSWCATCDGFFFRDQDIADPKLSFAWNSTPVEALGADGKVCGLMVSDTMTGEQRIIDVTGIFVAIGHDPRTELVKGQVGLDDSGYITVAHPTTATNLPGVFSCGDVVDRTYRQAITAAGTGFSAAMDAEHYLAARADTADAAVVPQ